MDSLAASSQKSRKMSRPKRLVCWNVNRAFCQKANLSIKTTEYQTSLFIAVLLVGHQIPNSTVTTVKRIKVNKSPWIEWSSHPPHISIMMVWFHQCLAYLSPPDSVRLRYKVMTIVISALFIISDNYRAIYIIDHFRQADLSLPSLCIKCLSIIDPSVLPMYNHCES